MRTLGGLEKGQNVLIIGAGGGVGSIAVSIATRLGAHVTAVCSSKDVKYVQSLGADVVMDRSKFAGSMWKSLKSNKYNVIFDTPCAQSALRASKFLKPNGTYVAPVPSLSLYTAKLFGMFTGKKSEFIECHSKKDDLELIGEWLVGGMPVAIDSTYKVKDLTKAMSRQRSRNKRGRVAIQVEEGW